MILRKRCLKAIVTVGKLSYCLSVQNPVSAFTEYAEDQVNMHFCAWRFGACVFVLPPLLLRISPSLCLIFSPFLLLFSFKLGYMGLRPACFLVTFCTMQKVTTRSPSQEVSRFSKPRINAPQPQLPTATIKTFYKGSSEVLQTSNQRTQTTTAH